MRLNASTRPRPSSIARSAGASNLTAGSGSLIGARTAPARARCLCSEATAPAPRTIPRAAHKARSGRVLSATGVKVERGSLDTVDYK